MLSAYLSKRVSQTGLGLAPYTWTWLQRTWVTLHISCSLTHRGSSRFNSPQGNMAATTNNRIRTILSNSGGQGYTNSWLMNISGPRGGPSGRSEASQSPLIDCLEL